MNSWDVKSYIDEELNKKDCNCDQLLNAMLFRFPKEAVIAGLNYILDDKEEIELLNKTIRFINIKRYNECLKALIDFILKARSEACFLNLKVLAIKTISNFKDTSAVPSLLFCLNNKDSNYKIRLAAAEALGKIGDKNAFEALGNVICDEKEKSTYIKESAVVALGMLGDSRALDVFETIMTGKQMFLDKFSYLKERVVESISKFDISRDRKALEILKSSLHEPSSQVRIGAIETLMNSDINEAYDLIYERLCNDIDLEVKKNALVALYNISDRKILDEVLAGDFDIEIKDYAQELIDEYEESDE